jgi:hypothetical protein
MSEEQMRILKMLSDQRITVEQAERLLAAIEEGGGAEKAPAQEAMDKLGKVIGGLMAGEQGVPWHMGHDDDGDEVGPEGLELPEGSEMVLKVRGSNVFIRRGTDGRKVTFSVASGARPRARVDGNTCRVSIGPGGGKTDIFVPELTALAIRLTGGHVEAQSIGCSVRANVKGGDLCVGGCEGRASLKCMGGAISLSGHPERLEANCMGGGVRLEGVLLDGGKHTIKVMGGDVAVELDPASSVRIETSTMGGEVRSDLPSTGTSGGHIKRAAGYLMGDGEGLLSIRLLGGDVRIAEADAGAGSAAEPAREGR